MKLWQKDSDVHSSDVEKRIEKFTVGSDKHWDTILAKYDVIGSLAHAEMLSSVGLITKKEFAEIKSGLNEILELIQKGRFIIEEGIEDVHSQIEMMLTKNIGEAGKKIHTGRSRNDQSILDIKLFLRNEIIEITRQVSSLFDKLIQLSEKHKNDLMPGYTHMQLAMPSSFGLWFAAYAESLSDDVEMLIASYNTANRNPLGSGAGYGSSFPLDRTLTTDLMKFDALNVNSIYAQMTRGKTERMVAYGLSVIASTLSRFSMDICLFLNQHFDFISFPANCTTGSSIMPHKKNPDVFELIRAKCNKIQATPNQLTLLTANLISGYHRDVQLTKECLFPSIFDLKECLDILLLMLENITVRKEILNDEKYDCLFSVEAINKLVMSGIPFRDAYKIIANKTENNEPLREASMPYTHEGSIANLQNEFIVEDFKKRIKNIPKVNNY